MGAGVPRPCSAKRANASTSPGTPARIIIAPMPRVSSRPRNGGRSCQPVIDHGTSPASVHGATTKKTAEPRTAMVRCTAVPDTRTPLHGLRRHPGADTLVAFQVYPFDVGVGRSGRADMRQSYVKSFTPE